VVGNVNVGLINNNNNNNDDRYGSVILLKEHCESSPGSCDVSRKSAGGCRHLDQANQLEPEARL